MTALAAWQNFYVIAGSSAGALIGLQFVVLTLIANMPAIRVDALSGGTFATPTIIHFSAVLALAAILCAPWLAITPPLCVCALAGIAGLVYIAVVGLRMRRTAYQPEFEDWLFHVVLPLVSYGTLAVSPLAAPSYARESLFGVAAGVLLLLLIGIHNAWDAVTYHVYFARKE